MASDSSLLARHFLLRHIFLNVYWSFHVSCVCRVCEHWCGFAFLGAGWHLWRKSCELKGVSGDWSCLKQKYLLQPDAWKRVRDDRYFNKWIWCSDSPESRADLLKRAKISHQIMLEHDEHVSLFYKSNPVKYTVYVLISHCLSAGFCPHFNPRLVCLNARTVQGTVGIHRTKTRLSQPTAFVYCSKEIHTKTPNTPIR